jgi:hypothetical protein
MRSIFPIPAVLACLACTVASLPAQEIRFAGIPWETPVDSVRARVEAAGWPYHNDAPFGDLAFVRPTDHAEVDLYVDAGHVISVVQIDAARGGDVDTRFHVLADSMQALLHEPVDQRPQSRQWESGLTSVSVAVIADYQTGERTVQMQWRGPRYLDAMESRERSADFPRPLPGWMTVKSSAGMRTVADTARVERRVGGVLAATYRTEFLDARTLGNKQFDALEIRVELDCAGGRVRGTSGAGYLHGQRQGLLGSDPAWLPARAGTDPARVLDAVCRAAGRGPAVIAAPAATPGGGSRAFGPVPDGWMVVSEDVEVRRLLRPGSITPLGGGVYAATMLVEDGAPKTSPYGRVDASRFEFQVNCGNGQMRILRRITQLAGRDVHAEPPPAGFESWMPAPDNSPVPIVLCRIARERGL